MTIAERKEREKEQRRKDILDSAEALFFSRGYDSVSMDDIAKAAEINKATIYLYFKDKESLFFAVVLRGARILREMVKKNIEGVDAGIERLFIAGKAYIDFAAKYPDYLRLYDYFLSGRFDLGDMGDMEKALSRYMFTGFACYTDMECAKEIITIRQETLSVYKDAIIAGIRDRDIRNDIDPMEAAVLFALLLRGVQGVGPDLQIALESGGIEKERFAENALSLFRDMIKAKKEPKKK